MKMLNLFIVLVILQLGILVFDSTYSADSFTLNPYGASEQNVTYSAWDFVLNPTGFLTSDWIKFLLGVFTMAAVGGLVTVGLFLITKQDIVLRGGMGAVLIGLGGMPIVNLYLIINREVGAFACSAAEPCLGSIVIGFFFSGILAASWVFCVLEWVFAVPISE